MNSIQLKVVFLYSEGMSSNIISHKLAAQGSKNMMKSQRCYKCKVGVYFSSKYFCSSKQERIRRDAAAPKVFRQQVVEEERFKIICVEINQVDVASSQSQVKCKRQDHSCQVQKTKPHMLTFCVTLQSTNKISITNMLKCD